MSLPKITGFRARAVEAPLSYPIKTASGIHPTAPLVLLEIRTDAEITGQAYLFGYTPASLKPLVAILEEIEQMVSGATLAPEAIDRQLRKKFVLLGTAGLLRMALATVEMALWDAWCKHLGLPLTQVLGGELKPTRAYDSHSMDGETLAVERALRSAQQGFTGIKTKIGYADFDVERKVLVALRRELGDTFNIFVDYNQSLTISETLRRHRLLLDLNIGWIEEPLSKDDHLGHATITQSVATDIQLGENWFGPEDMMLSLRAGAGSLAMVDIMKMGGVCAWMKAAALAEQYSRPMSSHLFPEISAHMLALTPTADWLEWMDVAGGVLTHSVTFKDGMAHPSDAPGTGVSFDEDRIAALLA